MQNFYMVWVAGRGAPARLFNSLAAALESAERLRREVTGREVFVLAPANRLPGRGLLPFEDGVNCRAAQVEPEVIVKKRRRIVVPK